VTGRYRHLRSVTSEDVDRAEAVVVIGQLERQHGAHLRHLAAADTEAMDALGANDPVRLADRLRALADEPNGRRDQ
jgi:hypothetical protein